MRPSKCRKCVAGLATVPHFREFGAYFPSIWRKCGTAPLCEPHFRRFEGHARRLGVSGWQESRAWGPWRRPSPENPRRAQDWAGYNRCKQGLNALLFDGQVSGIAPKKEPLCRAALSRLMASPPGLTCAYRSRARSPMPQGTWRGTERTRCTRPPGHLQSSCGTRRAPLLAWERLYHIQMVYRSLTCGCSTCCSPYTRNLGCSSHQDVVFSGCFLRKVSIDARQVLFASYKNISSPADLKIVSAIMYPPKGIQYG